MGVTIGYQKTEVGVIPNDWEVTEMSTTCKLINGRGFKPFEWKKEGLPIIRIQNLNGSNEFNYYDGVYDKKIEIENNQLLFAWSGSRGTSFGPHIWKGGKGVLNYHTWKVNVYENKIHREFFLHTLKVLTKQIEDSAHGASALVHVQKWEIEKVKFAIPKSKTEQAAIAAALSDADTLITSLKKLIAKKRLIKQGVMQKLLDPKEGWKEKTLFEIADNKKALFDDGDWIEAEHITDKGIRLIQTGNIGVGEFLDRESKKYIFPKSFTDLKCKEIYEGDLLICRLADPAGRACVLPDIKESKIITSVDVTIFRPRNEVANRVFLSNLFSTNNWLRKVGEMTGGTTHKRISRGALGRIKISLPSIQEQNEIAAILFDMDNEIKVIHNKLQKVRLQKQGMMQTLLTGKIRLI